MEININISGGSVKEIKDVMHDLLHGTVVLHRTVEVAEEVPDTGTATVAGKEVEIIQPAPKAEPATIEGEVNKADAPTDATTVNETAPAEVSEPYLVAAIKAFIKAKGENDAWALFTKYGAKNRSTLLSSGKAAEAIAEIEAAVGVEAIKAEMAE